MTAHPDGPDPARNSAGWPLAKWMVAALMSYWGVYALVAPVNNWDSQTYNIGRLYIARLGGLFGNQGWTTERQVVFPWTFDAIHYPFLFLHLGYDLPSFLCLVGILIIVYRLAAPVTSPQTAWWCCLSLLALPTFVFQATSTKNDMAVVFGVGCWFYVWQLWQQEERPVYLVFAALALGFTAGAKTSGLPYAFALGAFTLWQLRTSRESAIRFALWLAAFLVLFGSVEIYFNNWLLYHSPLGPRVLIQDNKNRDGLAGGAANFIRYCIGNMNVGVDAANPASPVAGWLENICRDLLRLTGLSGLGLRGGLQANDAGMTFLKTGWDAGSDFGPVGALALIASLGFVFARPVSDPVWKLAASGLASLALTSETVAWMEWNARFLVLPFALFTLALVLWVRRLGEHGLGRFTRSALLVLLIYSAIIYPLHSFGKKPADLSRALTHHTVSELQERPAMLEVVRDLRARTKALAPGIVLLHAGPDSWVVCFFELDSLHLQPAPSLDEATLAAASKGRSGRVGSRPVYILSVDLPIAPSLASSLILVRKYQEPETALFKWQPATEAAPSS